MSTNSLNATGTLLVDPGGANEAAGPTGRYVWDQYTDHGEASPGYKNNKRVYKSLIQHPDGEGGTTYWYRYYTGNHWITAPNTDYGLMVFDCSDSQWMHMAIA